jgi:hypothetical protein
MTDMDYEFKGDQPREPRKYPDGYRAARSALLTDTMCIRCGAIVGDHRIHERWHEALGLA